MEDLGVANILIVDDNDDVAQTFKLILEEEGHKVDRTATAYSTVLKAMRVPYDLILMDLLLRGPDGVVAALALHALGVSAPIIAVTGNIVGFDQELYERAGFAGKLLKPILPRELLGELSHHLKNPVPAILVIEDDAAFAKMLVGMIVATGRRVDVAPTGILALEMLSARTYALALVDLNLPDIKGEELVRRARELGSTTPMVAMSGDTSRIQNRDEFTSILSKPLRLGELMEVIATHLGQTPEPAPDSTSTSTPPPPPPSE